MLRDGKYIGRIYRTHAQEYVDGINHEAAMAAFKAALLRGEPQVQGTWRLSSPPTGQQLRAHSMTTVKVHP